MQNLEIENLLLTDIRGNMKIQQLGTSQSFEAKQRFITPKSYENIKTLLTKMNAETEIETRYYTFTSTITKSLKSDKAEFIDGRMFFTKKPEKQQMKKETLFTIGKNELVINNKNGEIIDYHKSFFSSWKKIIKNIEKYTDFFLKNYDNQELVKKRKVSIEGFTLDGWNVLENAKKTLKIQRLLKKTEPHLKNNKDKF